MTLKRTECPTKRTFLQPKNSSSVRAAIQGRSSTRCVRLGINRIRASRCHLLVDKSPPLVLDSGSEISKSTLFAVLHFGGWLLAGVVVFAWSLSVRGALVAGLDESVWIVTGIVLTFGFRTVISSRAIGGGSLCLDWLIGPFSQCGRCAGLVRELLGSDSRSVCLHCAMVCIGTAVSREFSALASQPWMISVRIWMTCSCLLLSWSSLYFCINAIFDMEARARARRSCGKTRRPSTTECPAIAAAPAFLVQRAQWHRDAHPRE